MLAMASAVIGFAQQTTTTTTVVKNVTTTVGESVSVAQQTSAQRKIAVFVQNRTRVVGMDDKMARGLSPLREK